MALNQQHIHQLSKWKKLNEINTDRTNHGAKLFYFRWSSSRTKPNSESANKRMWWSILPSTLLSVGFLCAPGMLCDKFFRFIRYNDKVSSLSK